MFRHLALIAMAGCIIMMTGCSNNPDPQRKTTAQVPASSPSGVELPDPLVFADGRKVSTPEQWRQRRQEIKSLFEQCVYGKMPPAPLNVRAQELSSASVLDGAATQRTFRLSFGPDGKLTIRLSLVIPQGASAKDPRPVILYLYRANVLPDDGMWPDVDQIVQCGYIGASFGNGDCVSDKGPLSEGFPASYPDYDWAALACWAWGMHRCVDWLVTQDYVAADKIAVTGHSRRGKASLLAAAFDERIALAAPSGSGCGGVSPSRLSQRTRGAERVSDITKSFPTWFNSRFAQYAADVDSLPVDQHMLIALMAPRPVITSIGLDDLWACPRGEQASMLAAEPVYRMLGAPGLGRRIGIHFRPGPHAMTREDWAAILDFCDQNLAGRKVDRRFDELPFPPR